ncbi:MAG: hypothetical protein IPG64_05880 [Haliea sp.]|nr:hypothetical protein [Haliea sp.]
MTSGRVAELAGGDDSRFGTSVALVGDTAFISAPRLLYANKRLGLVVRHERAVRVYRSSPPGVLIRRIDYMNAVSQAVL